MDWPALLAPGGLLGVLASLLALNFRALFRRDQQVWDLIEDYKAQVAGAEAALVAKDVEIREVQALVETWRERYYDLLVTGKPASLKDDTKSKTTGDT